MAANFNRGAAPKGPHPPRRADRIALDAEVTLRRSGQHQYRVRVYDASPLGCRIEFVERPALEERVWIKFDGLDAIEALVCWIDGFVVGVEFARAFYPSVFDALVARLR
jgi:hypothetical protein